MSDITSLICKNCGGHMNYNNNILVCESCASELLVDIDSNNFNIVAGKLEKYTGSSPNVLVPNTVVTIGENSFKGLPNLASVILPANVLRIENNAFEECIGLHYVDIPNSVNYIGDCAFKNSGLDSLIIRGNLNYIGNEAFMCCDNLKELTVSGTIFESGLKVFKHCSNLESVNMDLTTFAGSLKPSIEAKKKDDKRPTFFDFFQGTIFYKNLEKKHISKKCLYCNNTLDKNGVCSICGEKNYDVLQGCYVATAVYGSYDCPEVWTLRRYRDYTLAETWYGRAFIRIYYATSPTLVKWFGHTKWFKKMWKSKLDRIVAHLQATGFESTTYEDKNW